MVIETQEFICEECGKRFSTISGLGAHIRLAGHHNGSEKINQLEEESDKNLVSHFEDSLRLIGLGERCKLGIHMRRIMVKKGLIETYWTKGKMGRFVRITKKTKRLLKSIAADRAWVTKRKKTKGI